MFEQFMIGIFWIIGPFIVFVLLLGIVFAEGGIAQTNNTELHLISKGSMLLIGVLIWLGVSSLIGEDDDVVKISSSQHYDATTSVQDTKAPVSYTVSTSTAEVNTLTPPKEAHSKTGATLTSSSVVASKKSRSSKVHYDEMDYLIWALYMLLFLIFMWWVYGPSKKRSQERKLMKDKFVATMKFEADEVGRRPWHTDWKDESSK